MKSGVTGLIGDSARGLLPDNYETLDPLAKCEALDAAGLLYWSKGEKGRPRWKKYLSAMPGVVAGDLGSRHTTCKGQRTHRLSHAEASCTAGAHHQGQ